MPPRPPPPFIEWAREVWASPYSPIGRRTSLQKSCLRRACRPSLGDRGTSGSSPTPFACSPAAICKRKSIIRRTKCTFSSVIVNTTCCYRYNIILFLIRMFLSSLSREKPVDFKIWVLDIFSRSIGPGPVGA
jgi:hypothetical protein